MTSNFMRLKRNKVELVSDFHSTCQLKLLPTIDHSFLINDGYHEEETYLDIDYQEADYGNDLDLAAPNCDKSQQHDEFIEYDDFSLNCLPADIQHSTVVVWIRYAAQLVVRLSRSVNASGRVFVIKKHLQSRYTCKDQRCPYDYLFGPDHSIYGGLGIITNKHVVKTHEEARESKVEFFYHSDDRRDMVVKEKGHHVYFTDHNLDYTMFTCNMHRPDLVQHIDMCTDIAKYAWRCIPKAIRDSLKKFAIVISHPHGSSKRISIGKVIGFEKKGQSKEANRIVLALRDLYKNCEKSGNNGLIRFQGYFNQLKAIKDFNITLRVYYYDAATCPGSSGAPVYMGITHQEDGVILPHTHRGRHPVNGYNNCYI